MSTDQIANYESDLMVFNIIFLVAQFLTHMFGSAIKYINYHTFHGKKILLEMCPQKRFYMCYVFIY